MPYSDQSLLSGAYSFSLESSQAQALEVPMNKECKVTLKQITISKVKIRPVKTMD